MSADDLVPLGDTGHWARRAIAAAWDAAGRPPINSALRLYDEQKQAYDDAEAGRGAPADNPDDERQPLAHCRGVALDITPTRARIRSLEAAGLVRPYDYETWHWQLPGDVRRYPIIRALPAPPREEFLMALNDGEQARLLWWTEQIGQALLDARPEYYEGKYNALQILLSTGVQTRDYADDTHNRVRGPRDEVDMLQDILGQVAALRAEVAALRAEVAALRAAR